MTRRRAELLAWGLWGLCILALVAVTSAFGRSGTGFSLGASVPFLLFATVGAIVAARRPDNRIGWLYLTIGLLAAFTGIAGVIENLDFPGEGAARLGLTVLYAVANVAWYPTLGLLATLSILWFPDGRPPTRRWRWVEVAVAVGIIGIMLAFALVPGRINGSGTPDNPFGIRGASAFLGAAQSVFGVVFLVTIVASVASFAVRFRRSRGVERQQLRWFLAGAGILGVGIIVSIVVNPPGNWWFAVTTSALPLAAGIAITRYHLYDLDRLLSRTIAYLAVSALLVGIYAGIVVGIGTLTGSSDSPLLIAGGTLAVAALVRPVLGRVRSGIDRRFNRRRYDAQRALEGFSTRLRDQVALEQVRSNLLGTVHETLQPSTASVWLRGGVAPR